MGFPFMKKQEANTVRLQIETSLVSSGVTKFEHNDTFLLKINKWDNLRKLDEMEELFDNQTFVIFKNEDDFFIRAFPENSHYRYLERYFKNEYWKECYVFGNESLIFSSGVEHIFVNRFVNTMRKFANPDVIFNQYCNDGDPSNVLSVVEQNEYEQMWEDLKTIMKNNGVNILPFDFLIKPEIMKRSLFNVYSDTKVKSQVGVQDVFHLLSSDEENIVEYILRDNLGNIISAFTLHQLYGEWVKELYRIPRYKKLLIELAEHERSLDAPYSKSIFWTRDSYPDDKKIDDNLWLHLYENKDGKRISLSSDKAKKRMAILASLLNVRFNIEENMVAEPSKMMNNPDFEEEMEQEELKRNEKRTQLVEKLKEISAQDLRMFDEDYGDHQIDNFDNSYIEGEEHLDYLDDYDIEDDDIDFSYNSHEDINVNKDTQNIQKETEQKDRAQKSDAMDHALAELIGSNDQEFKNLFKKN